jgi:hypothetical protein
MQGASACNVCWFGITWDFELYDQFIRRIWRDGTKAGQVFNHLLVVKGTIDELKLAALEHKDMTQSGLLRALNTEIRRNADTHAAGDAAANDRRNEPVVMKLSRPGTAAAPAQDNNTNTNQGQQTGEVVRPKGWGKPAGGAVAQQEPEQAPAGQQERIQETLRTGGSSAFSGNVADKVANIVAEHGGGELADGKGQEIAADAPRKTRTRSASAGEAAGAALGAAPVINLDAKHSVTVPDTSNSRLIAARVALLTAVMPLAESPEQAMEVADGLWQWAANPDALPAF